MTAFNQLPTTIKGNLGEFIVDKYLLGKNIIPYSPKADIAHPFDRLCASTNKKNIFIAEVKTKASRSYYPDTGINLKSYEEYKFIENKYGIDVWMFFVDEYKKKIYGNKLSNLDKPVEIIHKNKILNYPLIQPNAIGRKIIYFPLEFMVDVCDIDDKVSEELKELSTRSYEYERNNNG